MIIKKIIAWTLGILCTCAWITGLLLLIPSKALSITLAVIIICLSLCFGIILPNPICPLTFATGICILIFPPKIVAIVLLCIGVVGSLANLFGWKNTFVNKLISKGKAE